MAGRLEGKVALVSGSARGIGEADARLFVAEGAKVVMGDVLDEEGRKVAADLGSSASYVHLDVTSPESWSAAVSHAQERFGKLDVLVNNAGILRFNSIEETSLDEYEAVIRVNERQRERMVEKIETAAGGTVEGKTIAILGLSFKPETDDMRDAPAVDIIHGLQSRGAVVRAFDPVAMTNASPLLPEVTLCKDSYEACENADAVVLVTEWNQFRMLDLARVQSVVREPVLVDLRNVYEPGPMREAGFRYVSVGR